MTPERALVERAQDVDLDSFCACKWYAGVQTVCEAHRAIAAFAAEYAREQVGPCKPYCSETHCHAHHMMRELAAARQREEEAKANADFLRESIGECHVMISRNLAEFQLRHDWEATTLPHLLQRILLERDALRAENDRLTLAASESARTLQVEIAAQQEQAGMVIGELKARVAELQGLNEQLNRHEHELSNQVTALREALASIRADIVKHDRYFSGAQDWRCEDCCGEWPDENGTPPEKTDGLECDARRTLVIVDAALAAIPQDGA